MEIQKLIFIEVFHAIDNQYVSNFKIQGSLQEVEIRRWVKPGEYWILVHVEIHTMAPCFKNNNNCKIIITHILYSNSL